MSLTIHPTSVYAPLYSNSNNSSWFLPLPLLAPWKGVRLVCLH